MTFFHHPTDPIRQECQGQQCPEGWTGPHTEEESAAWAAGFTPAPPVAVPPAVPAEVSNQQLRLALIEFGIMPSAILAQLQAMPAGADREKALAAWEYANTFRREHHLVASLASQIGLTSAQVDDLFRLAETLG